MGSEEDVRMEDADLGAGKPVPQVHYKPQPVLLSVVVKCGHKLDIRNFPKQTNCEGCWEAFFAMNPDGVSQTHQILLNEGSKAVGSLYGRKFLKHFGVFLRGMMLQKYNESQAQPQEPVSGIEGSILDIASERRTNVPQLQ